MKMFYCFSAVVTLLSIKLVLCCFVQFYFSFLCFHLLARRTLMNGCKEKVV